MNDMKKQSRMKALDNARSLVLGNITKRVKKGAMGEMHEGGESMKHEKREEEC